MTVPHAANPYARAGIRLSADELPGDTRMLTLESVTTRPQQRLQSQCLANIYSNLGAGGGFVRTRPPIACGNHMVFRTRNKHADLPGEQPVLFRLRRSGWFSGG